jgi:hypothetical protein
MNNIKVDFGEFAVCAYSNDKEIADEIGCKYNEFASKLLSLHIVFYDSCVKIIDLQTLFDENKYIIYIKQDDKITKEEVNVTLECIVSEPFDDSVFLASHIRLTNKKVNY